MDLGLNGKVAMVAAASKGLGKATAMQLAAEGASVMIVSRSEEALARTASEIRERTGSLADYCVADLMSREDIRGAVSRAAERFGGLDVLINNSGGPPAGTFDDFEDEDWRHAFELNLLSLIRLVRVCDGVAEIDATGKRSGRGAYLCRFGECWETGLTRRALDHALKTELTSANRQALASFAAQLPRTPPGRIERV